jgi:hypothetical protein
MLRYGGTGFQKHRMKTSFRRGIRMHSASQTAARPETRRGAPHRLGPGRGLFAGPYRRLPGTAGRFPAPALGFLPFGLDGPLGLKPVLEVAAVEPAFLLPDLIGSLADLALQFVGLPFGHPIL